MAWVRLDDAAMDHPKILALSDAQFRLWVHGLCYCQKHLTDGFIPDRAVKLMMGRAEQAKALCDAGLWDVCENQSGFMVHDYLDWNDSRTVVSTRKKRAKERKQKWVEEHIPNTARTGQERVPNTSHNQTKPKYVQSN